MAGHRSFSARASIEAILEARGAQRLDVPVVQPADAFLDTAGEELRRRIFLTSDDKGAALCLRPEFTIPVCLSHIKSGEAKGRYGYVGTVFRQRRAGGSEFLQAGIEDIGNENRTAADSRAIADAVYCVSKLGAAKNCQMLIGDQAVFDAVLAALGLPKGWRLQLAHAFGDKASLDNALDALSQPPQMPDLPDALLSAASAGDVAKLETLVSEQLAEASLLNSGGRGPAEITARLMAKVQAANDRPDPSKLDVLRAFLNLTVPLDEATSALEMFESAHSLNLAAALSDFAKRNASIAAEGLDLSSMVYDASFGRPLDYYTGLVFEMRSKDALVLAGGGRYDRLLPLLGSKTPMPGVGFSLWLDRIAKAGENAGANL